VAWLAVQTPYAAGDPAAVVALAAHAATAAPKRADYRTALAAAQYRAGNFEEALQQLKEAIDLDQQGGSVGAELFLAMTQHQLGAKDEARQWLDKASQQIEHDADPANKEPPAWDEKLRRHLLRSEAQALLGEAVK
jgi:Flp pilus assembly protein TadD